MKKILIIFLSISFLLTASASVVGIIEHNKKNNPTNNSNNTPSKLVSYEYYLENEKVDEMPKNDINGEVRYVFAKYLCTNNLSGTFDNNLWMFTPSEDKESTCSLYFAKSQYEVTISATNGIVQNDKDGVFTIPRESEGTFSVVPNEGYKYKNVVCSNKNKAIYDISSKNLIINAVMEDMACKVNFEIMKFKAKINVINGTGTTTEVQKYGGDISVIVKANSGYEKPTVRCTNNQNATIRNNTLNIYKITDNTTCTVTYKKIPIVTHVLKFKLGSNLRIVSGTLTQKVKNGTDGKISIKPDDGYNVSVSCNVKPSSTTTDADGTVNYTFLNVTKDITCTATANESN